LERSIGVKVAKPPEKREEGSTWRGEGSGVLPDGASTLHGEDARSSGLEQLIRLDYQHGAVGQVPAVGDGVKR
jgi:hypothetical protein